MQWQIRSRRSLTARLMQLCDGDRRWPVAGGRVDRYPRTCVLEQSTSHVPIGTTLRCKSPCTRHDADNVFKHPAHDHPSLHVHALLPS